MLTTTPIYSVTAMDDDHPLADLALVTRLVADTVEAALVRGGIAPPEAQDLATLAGRVTTLETDVQNGPPGRRVTKTGGQAVTTAWTLLTWENLASSASGPGMWSAANPSRLVATRPGRHRLLLSNFGVHAMQVRKNAAGNNLNGEQVAALNGASVANLYLNVPGDEIPMLAGDYVEAWGVAPAAGTMGTQQGYTAYFSLTWIGA